MVKYFTYQKPKKTPRGAVDNRLFAPMFISRYLQLLVTTFTTQVQLNHTKQNS